MAWLKHKNFCDIPVITFSGIPANNEHLKSLGAEHIFIKNDVIAGKANDIILRILGFEEDE